MQLVVGLAAVGFGGGSDAVRASWVLRWETPVKGTPAGKVRTASPKLVVDLRFCGQLKTALLWLMEWTTLMG